MMFILEVTELSLLTKSMTVMGTFLSQYQLYFKLSIKFNNNYKIASYWGLLRICVRFLTHHFILIVVHSLSHVLFFATPWPTAHQVSLSLTISQSPLKLMSIESVMPSNHLILCHCLLLPSVFPSIRVFSNELVLHIRWPKYWSFSFSISPSKE